MRRAPLAAPQPSPSVWDLVKDHVPPSERAEVKTILGEAAVDLNLELRAEVETLLELLEEERSAQPARPPPPCTLLAPSPLVRDIVKQELFLLLDSLRRKATQDGRDGEDVLAQYSPRVVRFALGLGPEADAKGDEGRPEMPALQNAAIGNEHSTWDLDSIKDKLNLSGIDQVVQHLRGLLEAESQALERDISVLQCCLEEAHNWPPETPTTAPEPTLAELKEEKRAMERALCGKTHPSALQKMQPPATCELWGRPEASRNVAGAGETPQGPNRRPRGQGGAPPLPTSLGSTLGLLLQPTGPFPLAPCPPKSPSPHPPAPHFQARLPLQPGPPCNWGRWGRRLQPRNVGEGLPQLLSAVPLAPS
ncbi:coiled-coil domain-containing protein 24 isoform X2 [Tachyglossus aculeatus]|uniref:coiled-coil domain-containing protein 24 isoform X2 n=1 Tax=Tachyglossus aculeatus TaxID=9261 RepID=UPI0018F6A85D|nr:coiled-coil domain-containing protein 24 isoform X2 [Tachyglossus aculeatus]